MVTIWNGCLWCGDCRMWLYGWPVVAEHEWQFALAFGVGVAGIS